MAFLRPTMSDDCPDCGDPLCMGLGCDSNVAPEDDEANWASTNEISQMADDEVEVDQMLDYQAMRGNPITREEAAQICELSKLQDAEQAEFEAIQPKLTPAQYQELELARFNSNEEADHAKFSSDLNINLCSG